MVGMLALFGAMGALVHPSAGQDAGIDRRLGRLLERARAYCHKLEKASLDFTCIEKIEEKLYRMPETQVDNVINNPTSASGSVSYSYVMPRPSHQSHTYVYDYQFVRKGDRQVERRMLIEEDGRKKKADDAELVTEVVRVENALFGPVGLFGESSELRYDHRIAGEEIQGGRKIVIVEAAPKPGPNPPRCYGRAWVREDDGAVVKISWDQASVGNFQTIQARADSLGAEPQLTSVTEYGREKNGLRFPSKDTTEEAYLKKGKKHVLSRSTILYKDYKFFTVETEVRF